MIRSSGRLWLARLAVAALLGLIAATAGSGEARAATGRGIVTAAGHPWIVVAKGVPCTNAKQVVRGFAARTAALRNGASIVVPSPLRGFHCLLASRGKPGGSCTTAGAAKSILWLGA
jgi:hypothetical protein